MTEYENDPALEDIDDDTSVEADPGEQSTKATVRGARGTRRPVQITRAGATRSIEKYVELTGATDQHIHLLTASLDLPSGTDLVAIAATIVAGKKQPAVTTLLSLADKAEDPYQAMLHAMDLGRDEVKQTWQLLATAQLAGVSGALPSKDSAAAVAVAKAAGKLTAADRSLLGEVAELARR